ncbi:MAG TPA: LacI family DNA-binding transcriptional regulator [Anaerolineaceae bacterium]|jgi:LacI family transcriptional regulator|nr:LacI family DNA-binding transcriptional regulator [Anaerolineaceae bacterium]
MPSIYDVAREAGVSIGTVSYALNHTGRVSPETAERVRQAASRLNYQPKAAAQALARGRTLTISLVAPLDIYGYQASLNNLIAAIGNVLAETDFRLFIHPTLNRPNAWLELEASIRSHQMDGVILLHVQPGDPRVELLRRSKIPFVLIGRCEDTVGLSFVDADIDAAVQVGVHHLVEHGHTHIGMLGEHGEAGITSRLVEQFKLAIQAHGLSYHPEWCAQVNSIPEEATKAALRVLSADPGPTAIFAATDMTVMSAYNAAHHLGKNIPNDLAVIGYADSPIYPLLDPPCSAVFGGAAELGRLSAQLLIEQLTGDNPTLQQMLIPPELIQRGSTEIFHTSAS